MARLPDPEFKEIQVYNSDEVVERMKVFHSCLKEAVMEAEAEERRKENKKDIKP